MDEYSRNNYDLIVEQVERGNENIPQELANRVIFVKNTLHELGNRMARMSNSAISYILNDSIIDYDLLRAWYEVVRTPIAKYSLAETYYEEGRYENANAVLATIPRDFNYSETENYQHSYYLRFHNLKNILARDNRRWNNLNENEIAELRNIRDAKAGRSSVMAGGALCFYFGDCLPIELPNFAYENETKSFVQTDNYPSQPDSQLSTSIYVYPNPTNDFVEIISLNQEVVILSCEVSSITGTKLLKINNNESILKIDFSKFEQGIYFVKAILSNGNVENIKIVKL